MSRLLLLNGPNLNLLGTREPEIYGRETLADVVARATAVARELGHELTAFQSNAEHELIERIQRAPAEGLRFAIINPGGLHPHQRRAARRARRRAKLPFIEVHSVEHLRARAVPPSLVFVGHRRRLHRRPRPDGLRTRRRAAAARPPL
jgi:3-dehydroquinate dehydratase